MKLGLLAKYNVRNRTLIALCHVQINPTSKAARVRYEAERERGIFNIVRLTRTEANQRAEITKEIKAKNKSGRHLREAQQNEHILFYNAIYI